MEDFLRPLQLRAVFENLLHISGDQITDWMQWAHDIFVPETPEIGENAFVSLYTAIRELVLERTDNPIEGDIVSLVCQLEEVDGRPPTLDERIAVVLPLSIAGLESTGTLLGGMIHHFATHPDDYAEIVANPALVPDAVEEGLRMFANVTALQRTTTCPVSIGGSDLEEGAKVWTSYNARQPRSAEVPRSAHLERAPRGQEPHRVQHRATPLPGIELRSRNDEHRGRAAYRQGAEVHAVRRRAGRVPLDAHPWHP